MTHKHVDLAAMFAGIGGLLVALAVGLSLWWNRVRASRALPAAAGPTRPGRIDQHQLVALDAGPSGGGQPTADVGAFAADQHLGRAVDEQRCGRAERPAPPWPLQPSDPFQLPSGPNVTNARPAPAPSAGIHRPAVSSAAVAGRSVAGSGAAGAKRCRSRSVTTGGAATDGRVSASTFGVPPGVSRATVRPSRSSSSWSAPSVR